MIGGKLKLRESASALPVKHQNITIPRFRRRDSSRSGRWEFSSQSMIEEDLHQRKFKDSAGVFPGWIEAAVQDLALRESDADGFAAVLLLDLDLEIDAAVANA